MKFQASTTSKELRSVRIAREKGVQIPMENAVAGSGRAREGRRERSESRAASLRAMPCWRRRRARRSSSRGARVCGFWFGGFAGKRVSGGAAGAVAMAEVRRCRDGVMAVGDFFFFLFFASGK